MMHKNNGQIDVFNYMIFDKLIPKDHLLVKINSILDFSFIYGNLKDLYSKIGRNSIDPVIMFKMLLLEYIYVLSDVKVEERTKTDIVFRWFLGLTLDDSVPDATSLSYFRKRRLNDDYFDKIFNEIIFQCIEKGLIKTNRFMIDSTDVAANVNYPSKKKLITKAFNNVIIELGKFNKKLAINQLKEFQNEIDYEYEMNEKVRSKVHFEIAKKHMEILFIKTYDKLQKDNKYQEAYSTCSNLINQYLNNTKDKIISIVDIDARVAHKSPGNVKKGYKNHILVDEESEIIIASIQTPFNVGDEKILEPLLKKVKNEIGLEPEELSADKV